MNRGPQYVPFHIINRDGVTVPAKYIRVKMTNNPYAYGMLDSQGEVFKDSSTPHPCSTSPPFLVSAPTISHPSASTTRTHRALTMRWHA